MTKARPTTRRVALLIAMLISIAFPATVYGVYWIKAGQWVPIGIDPASNGNIWVSRVIGAQAFEVATANNYPPADNEIALIDPDGNTLWALPGFAMPHSVDVLPNGNLLVSDCGRDRVVSVDYPSGNITWDWEPSRINWTEVNPEWGPNHYY